MTRGGSGGLVRDWPVRAARWLAHRRRRAALGYLLALLAGGLLLMLRQVDAVLGRMSAIGDGVRGSGLAFPWSAGDIARNAQAWRAYTDGPRPGTAVVASVEALHTRLLWLDLAFVGVYVPLLALALGTLLRWAAARFRQPMTSAPRAGGDGTDRDGFDAARVRMLRWALRALVVLAVVDVVEDVLLHVRYVVMPAAGTPFDWAFVAVTGAKVATLLVVVGPMAVAAGSAVRASRTFRSALTGARGVVVVVGLLVVLLVLLSMGTEQIDDVVRAWRWPQALIAVLTTVAAALVVAGAVRQLTDGDPEDPRPDEGDDPQPLLLRVGIGLAVVGGALWGVTALLGEGVWGLLVPAGIALALYLLGRVVVRPADVPAPAPDDAGPADDDARNDLDVQRAAQHGRRLAHLLAAVVCLVAAWTIARASTFDLLVRPGPSGSLWVLAPAGLAVAAAGLVIALAHRRRRWPWPLWVGPGALAFGLLWTTMVDLDATAVGLPTALGSLGVVMIGVAAAAAGLAAAVVLVRRSRLHRYALLPLLRLVGLRRFPAIALLLVWGTVVALLDPGGFHDVRREPGQTRAAPDLRAAYDLWRRADPGGADRGGARPLVIVAAQGGGIRAAVWTALVMECLFGPTEVVAGCPGSAADDGAGGLPVLVASGASGGSVGLAAWSARRVDRVVGRPTEDITRVLPADHLAPDLARLLSGDALHLLLAHDLPDRAEMLERSWERGAPGTGLDRGLRAAWDTANRPGSWEMPVLALNGTQVQDGCRFVASPVDMWLPGPTGATADAPDGVRCGAEATTGAVEALPRTTELVDHLCADEDVPLSAAGHLSSRFPYVSPTARVPAAEDCADRTGLLPPDAVTYLTDGGLADNSGAATAVQLWRALQPIAAEEEAAGGCVVPVFVQIDNTPDAEPTDGGTRPPNELTAPFSALLGQVGGREEMERGEARAAFAEVRTAGGAQVAGADGPAHVRIVPAVQPGAEAPLGWALAPSTVEEMRAQLVAEPNRAEIERLTGLLDGLTCPA